MKKTRVFLMAALCSITALNAFAQTWNSSSVSTTTTGSANIKGTLFNEGGLIDMNIPGSWSTGTPDPWRSLNCNSQYSGLYLCTGANTNNGSYIKMYTPQETTSPGAMKFVSNSPGAMGSGFSFIHHDFSAVTDNPLMDLDNWGRLTVRGGLLELYSTALGTDPFRSINCGSTNGGLYLCTGTSTLNGTTIKMNAPSEPLNPGGITFMSNSPGATGNGFSFIHHDISAATDNSLMDLDNWGRLTVKGGLLQLTSSALGTDPFRSINCGSTNGGLYICTGTNTTDGSYIQMHAPTESSNQGAIDLVSNNTGGFGLGISFYTYNGLAGPNPCNMRIYNDGNVAIGSDIIATGSIPNPTDYNLYVSKGILTEKLKVANTTDGVNWSDFVFNKDYDLMPLSDVETYVKKNKHLPEIPSAEEVAKEGIDVAAMDAKLLQKIEELTLYVIEQSKQINIQQKEIEKLKKKMN